MAPRTGLQLLMLHMAALLVVVAYLSSGACLADTIFQFDEISPRFDILRDRGCLPEDFNFSFPEQTTATSRQCKSKVLSGDVPDECADAAVLAQFLNCFANSMGELVTVDNVKSFDAMALENSMVAYSNEDTWKQDQSDRMSYCTQKAQASLGPQQMAVYGYLCINLSLFADCDRQQAGKGSLDESAMVRRELLLQSGVQMTVDAFGPMAELRWSVCSQKLYHGGNVTKRYEGMVSAVSCFLQDLVDDAGHIDTARFFELAEQAFTDESSRANLQELKDACGPDVAGYKNAKTEDFIKCIVSEGMFIIVESESNLASSAIPESCTISV